MTTKSLTILLLICAAAVFGEPSYRGPVYIERSNAPRGSAPRTVPAPATCAPRTLPVAPTPCKIPQTTTHHTPHIKGHKPLVVLDPGHGGEDFGAKSLDKPVYNEKNLTLIATRFLQGYLHQMGIPSVMTRNKDVFVELDRRVELASEHECQLFVSMHFNAAPSRQADGIEVYYYDSDKDKKRTKASKALAESVLGPIIEATQAKSRGVKHGNYLVIRETDMPAILIEAGFLTNADEMTKIKDPTYLKQLAHGVALGIADYIARTAK